MLNCKQVSRLVSESLDRKLSLWQRLNLWMHLSLCRFCAGFYSDIKHLHRAAERHAEEIENDSGSPDEFLSPDARRRIKQALMKLDS
ncbi:MAG: hypothetical protein QGF59_17315 [Pirellulaceae bacterium]|jgi:predicted anti-sigma-YlaC factor YlaD|nr:hypothetical protein [Pirellulaceae bacterium]MDP6720426.1 hypothetical protein [Pirellulaceae bacterium]